jgi:hypothetical protein
MKVKPEVKVKVNKEQKIKEDIIRKITHKEK